MDMERRVDHKSDNLECYLGAISANLIEKTEILRYIIENNGGRYLEIGSGGDPFATIVEHSPPHTGTELVAIDADPAVLDHLLVRNPSIPETARQKGISIDLIPMDATNMQSFADESFEGINASSLVHEIFSYAEGFEGIQKFVRESNRILKPGGVLVYRDPELHQPLTRARMEAKDPHLKAFSLFYLLNAALNKEQLAEDDKLSLTRLDCLYDSANLTVTLTKLGEDDPVTLALDDLTRIKVEQVDFDQPVFIESENGALQEITRHFLTFHQSSPYGNILVEPDEQGGASIKYISNGTKERFNAFTSRYNIEVSDENRLSPENHAKLRAEIASTFDFLTENTRVNLEDSAANQLSLYVQQLKIDPDVFMEKKSDGTCTLDSMLLSVVFEHAVQDGIISKDSFVNETAFNFFTYLKQEAQEFYYYLTPDEVIAVFAAVSLERDDGHMLVPSPDNPLANRTIERPKYDMYLNSTMSVDSLDPDVTSEAIAPRENKHVIHFTKVPTEEGIEALRKLAESDEAYYHTTMKFLSNTPLVGRHDRIS